LSRSQTLKEGRKEGKLLLLCGSCSLSSSPAQLCFLLCYTPSFLPSFLEATGYRLQIHRSDSSPSSSRSPGRPFSLFQRRPAGQFPSHRSIILFLSSLTNNHQSHTTNTSTIHQSYPQNSQQTHPSTDAGRPASACLPGLPAHPSIHHP